MAGRRQMTVRTTVEPRPKIALVKQTGQVLELKPGERRRARCWAEREVRLTEQEVRWIEQEVRWIEQEARLAGRQAHCLAEELAG